MFYLHSLKFPALMLYIFTGDHDRIFHVFFAVDHFCGYAIVLHNQLISFTKPLIICLALLECFLCQNRCSIRGNILLHPLLGGNCLFVITHPGCHVMIPDNIQHVFLCPGNHGIRICICLFSDCCSYFCSSGFFAISFPSASTDITLLLELFQTGVTEAFNTAICLFSPTYSLLYPGCICKDVWLL